jgi:ADP-heptose:LPS heptosyltransferase
LKIVISRTDSIGDVALTLPLVGKLRQAYPSARLVFLGRGYTLPVLEAYDQLDECWNWDELAKMPSLQRSQWLHKQKVDVFVHVFPRKEIANWAKEAGVEVRVGTRSRLYHWYTCNRLVALHRKNSPLHEAQLNVALAIPHLLEGQAVPSLETLAPLGRLTPKAPLPPVFADLVNRPGAHLVLHPKSQGSAREWPLEHFAQVARTSVNSGTHVYISGTEKEGALLRNWIHTLPSAVTDLSGKLNLGQFITFLSRCTGIVACSTGPLHLGAGVGICAIGLYPPIRPIHPGRWAPLGSNSTVLTTGKPSCKGCRNKGTPCQCLVDIDPERVEDALAKCSARLPH